MPSTPLVNPGSAQSWTTWVTNFDATYAAFMENYDALTQIGPDIQTNFGSDPAMIREYDKLYSRATDTYNVLLSLMETREAVVSWLGYLQQGGQNSWEWFRDTFLMNPPDPGTFGVIPALAWTLAAAAAALYTASLVLDDIASYAERYNYIKAREAQGETTDEAIANANDILGPIGGGSSILGIPTNVILFAAVAMVLGPPIINALLPPRRTV